MVVAYYVKYRGGWHEFMTTDYILPKNTKINFLFSEEDRRYTGDYFMIKAKIKRFEFFGTDYAVDWDGRKVSVYCRGRMRKA